MKSSVRAPGDITNIALESDLPELDEVYEFPTFADFPKPASDPSYVAGSQVPETQKIYIADDTNRMYRWNGTAYEELSSDSGKTSVTLRVYDN